MKSGVGELHAILGWEFPGGVAVVRLGLARPCLARPGLVSAGAPAVPQAMGSGARGSALDLVVMGCYIWSVRFNPF